MIAVLIHEPVHAEPTPHDVFREQAWPADKSLGKLVFGNKLLCQHDQCEQFHLNALPLQSLTLDLQDATKVRAIPEYWSGHVGTSEKSLIFNPSAKQETDRFRKTSLSDLGQGWVSLPLPVNTPGSPECFHALLSHPAIDVDLGRLQHGSNQFTVWAGKQICYGFQYPALRLRSLVMRTFYKSSRPHANGTVIAPKPGATIGESVVVQAAVGGAVDTDRVEFFAEYDDFSWEGDGVSRRWHYRYDGGKLGRHVGTATHPPYQVTWNTEWLPTQSRPLRIKAHIIGENGITYVTPIVENLTLQRNHTVRLYNSSDVPQNFQSRVSKRKECTIPVPDELTTARAARLLVALGAPHEKSGDFGLNGKRLATVAADSGRNERAVSVPVSTLARSNRFYAYSDTPAHAMEIYWPGPALLVRFDQREGPASDAGVPPPNGCQCVAARRRPCSVARRGYPLPQRRWRSAPRRQRPLL